MSEYNPTNPGSASNKIQHGKHHETTKDANTKFKKLFRVFVFPCAYAQPRRLHQQAAELARPAFVICRDAALAELASRGTSPIAALTWPAEEKRATSSTNARNVSATTGPTPWTLCNRGTMDRRRPASAVGISSAISSSTSTPSGGAAIVSADGGQDSCAAAAARARCSPRRAGSPLAGVTTESAQSS